MSSSFLRPGVMTALGEHAGLVDALPADPAVIARSVQGLMIHEFWGGAYGVEFSEAERSTVNLRRTPELLAAIVERDGRPLDVAREPGARVATNCRGFTVVTVAMLRAKGIPARSRCGFGTYFTDGWFEDHWVAEFFDGARWRLLDAQIDEVQRGKLTIDFDLTDVPHDRFVIAGEGWRSYRDGTADPDRFGLSFIPEGRAWWIAANLMRDAAALAGVEVLPWDLWAGTPEPETTIDVPFFDELAEATAGPSMAAINRLAPPPAEVFNLQHKRLETL
jgi:transglutaminase-like putative cysteine protease